MDEGVKEASPHPDNQQCVACMVDQMMAMHLQAKGGQLGFQEVVARDKMILEGMM
jgi:hypothetical protein